LILFDIRMFIYGRHRIRIFDWRSLKKLLRKSKCRVVAIGLGSDAGDPGSNLVNVMLRYSIKVYMSVCTLCRYYGLFYNKYMSVECKNLLFNNDYATALLGARMVFCPAALLTNESLVQSANERSVWRNSGIWITRAASGLMTGVFPCCITPSHVICCWLKMYSSSYHWIEKSNCEYWNCAWRLSPGPSGKRHFLSRDMAWP
jgi:hypothetical protein